MSIFRIREAGIFMLGKAPYRPFWPSVFVVWCVLFLLSVLPLTAQAVTPPSDIIIDNLRLSVDLNVQGKKITVELSDKVLDLVEEYLKEKSEDQTLSKEERDLAKVQLSDLRDFKQVIDDIKSFGPFGILVNLGRAKSTAGPELDERPAPTAAAPGVGGGGIDNRGSEGTSDRERNSSIDHSTEHGADTSTLPAPDPDESSQESSNNSQAASESEGSNGQKIELKAGEQNNVPLTQPELVGSPETGFHPAPSENGHSIDQGTDTDKEPAHDPGASGSGPIITSAGGLRIGTSGGKSDNSQTVPDSEDGTGEKIELRAGEQDNVPFSQPELVGNPETGFHPADPGETPPGSRLDNDGTDQGADNDGADQGADNGGADNGAVDNGGADNSGADNGGADNGGADNGGADNGGADNGGADNGGADNGGADNGGADNGGADNGGADNGGADNGGADNGGADHDVADHDVADHPDHDAADHADHADHDTADHPDHEPPDHDPPTLGESL
jgi:hypothetical protein